MTPAIGKGASVLARSAVLLGVLGGTAHAQYNRIDRPSTAEQVRIDFNSQQRKDQNEFTRDYLQQEERRRQGDTFVSPDVSKPVGLDERQQGGDIVHPSARGGGATAWAKQNWRALCALGFIVGGGIWFLSRR